MLKNTFCHIPGIGSKSETKLWERNILCWEDLMNGNHYDVLGHRVYFLRSYVLESMEHLDNLNARFFGECLDAKDSWRIFPSFRNQTAYLDIETNGRAGHAHRITTISLYDGKKVYHYVRGVNLQDFVNDIFKYKVIVTYNGKLFDVPVIEKFFGIRLNHAHIDLRNILNSLGYKGGLKGCERKLGLDREELNGVTGYFAVLLWQDFRKRKNERALETLLAYNVLDAVNLEPLMVAAYNLKLKETPFADGQIPRPAPVQNPFKPDLETLSRLKDAYNL